MASIFETEGLHPERNRRVAFVSYLLSPKPPILLAVMIAVCLAWAALVTWAAMSLIKLVSS